MSYIQEKHNPTHMIDLATLTGACVVALGEETAEIFSNSNELSEEIQKAGNEVFENLWQMPINEEHERNVKGIQADLSNSKPSAKYGGACNAAAFLKRFVDSKVKWCHIDIAGTGMSSAKRGPICYGGTGFGVQTVINHLIKVAK